MFEIIPKEIDRALFYFHSAGSNSKQIAPFLKEIEALFPTAYIWAGDGNLSNSALISGHPTYGGPEERYWFVFPMDDACSEESFLKNKQSMGASLLSAGSFVNYLVDIVMRRYNLSADKIILSGFQHGGALALSAAMMRKYDPFSQVVLFEPYLLEAYFMDQNMIIPDTGVYCIDNEHIRKRTYNWIGVYTDEELRKMGMNAIKVTVQGGGDHLSMEMIRNGFAAILESEQKRES